jgi:hypothetical protein
LHKRSAENPPEPERINGMSILLHLVMDKLKGDTGLGEEILGFRTGVILAFADNPGYAAADDEHAAGPAGGHPAIKGGAVQGDSAFGGLAYGILLGMHSADTVLLLFAVGMNDGVVEMPHFIAVRESRRRADVSGGEDLPVFDNDTAAAAPVACGPH